MMNTYRLKPGIMRRFVLHINSLSKYPMLILNIALPLICVALIALVFMLTEESKVCAASALERYRQFIDYISRGLLAAVGSALVLDIASKRQSGGK